GPTGSARPPGPSGPAGSASRTCRCDDTDRLLTDRFTAGRPAGPRRPAAVLQAEAAADDLLHALVGAAVDRLHPAVVPRLGHRVFGHVAVTAVQLQARVRDLVLQVG